MPVTLEVRYLNGAAKTLRVLTGNTSNLLPAMTVIQELVLQSVRQNFVQGGRPVRWAPLKYPRARGARAAAVPLTDTGRLRASITGRVTPTSVVIGTNLPYAAIHQFGGTVQIPERRARPGRAFRFVSRTGQVIFTRRIRAHTVTIPARPYLLLQAQDDVSIVRIIEAHVTRGAL